MGTSELYSAVEQLSAVADSLVVDVEDGQGGSRLVMFVVPAAGEALDKPLVDAMSAGIRKALSPRFIPDHFVVAPGIPRTLSGKKQELPVKRLFQGSPLAKIMNLEAMANPEYNARRFDLPLDPYPKLVAADAAARTLDAFAQASPEWSKTE